MKSCFALPPPPLRALSQTSATNTTADNTTLVNTYAYSSDLSSNSSDPTPASQSFVGLSQLSIDFFSNLSVGLLEAGVEIAAGELYRQSQVNSKPEIYACVGEITNTANSQVVMW